MDSELINAVAELRKVRESLFKVSGSALLSGDKHGPDDKDLTYRLVCAANNTVAIVIDDLRALATQARPDGGEAAIREVIHELRTYNPPADPYNGKHIHPGWAKRLEAAITQQAGQ